MSTLFLFVCWIPDLGSGMTTFVMKSIKDLLPKTFHPAVFKQMRADEVCSAGERAVAVVFPDYVSEITVKYFKDGVLYLGVTSSALRTEFQFREKRILEKIHEFLRQEGVVEKFLVRM